MSWRLLTLVVGLVSLACSPGAPAARPTAPPSTRPAPSATPTPSPAAAALAIVPLRIQDSPLPPAPPTPVGFTSGRATPTPFATPEAAWKYLTLTFAVENRSDAAWLVGLGGSDPSSTNLAGAVLTTPDGARYKPIASNTTLGLRTATSHALTTYPVLLRLPPGFRATAESAGSVSVILPDPSSLTFKVPAGLSDDGTLSIPPLAALGPKTGDDDVTRLMRPLIAGFQPLQLSSVAPPLVSFPTDGPPPGVQPVGATVSVPGKLSVTLLGVETSDPEDAEVRNRGWKQVSVSLRYHNDDPSQPRAFDVVAWLFGEDGVVYTGDAPSIGDFGRALTPPDASALLLWDGRSAGADRAAAGQSLEPRRATFTVPRALHNAVLVLAGDVEATFAVTTNR